MSDDAEPFCREFGPEAPPAERCPLETWPSGSVPAGSAVTWRSLALICLSDPIIRLSNVTRPLTEAHDQDGATNVSVLVKLATSPGLGTPGLPQRRPSSNWLFHRPAQ